MSKERVLAEYIVGFLRRRNGGKLQKKLDAQTVADREEMIGELEMILQHGGKPPNWVEHVD